MVRTTPNPTRTNPNKPHWIQTHRHQQQQVKGYPVDYCSRYDKRQVGIGCGQEAADLWCEFHGFKTATLFLENPYAPNATWCLGDGRVNPADPDDRDSAVGRHTLFTLIDCTARGSAAVEERKDGVVVVVVEEEHGGH